MGKMSKQQITQEIQDLWLKAFLRDLDELFEGNGLSLVLEAQGSSLMIRLIKAEDADFNPSDWVNLVDLPLANSDK